MTATYDLSTPVGQLRLLSTDRDLTAPIFQDEELATFLLLEPSHIKRAAALALETIASDEALTQKVIRVQNLSTDGAATARVLLSRAQSLRDQAQADEDREPGGAFEVVEMPGTVFAERERIVKEWQRRGADTP